MTLAWFYYNYLTSFRAPPPSLPPSPPLSTLHPRPNLPDRAPALAWLRPSLNFRGPDEPFGARVCHTRWGTAPSLLLRLEGCPASLVLLLEGCPASLVLLLEARLSRRRRSSASGSHFLLIFWFGSRSLLPHQPLLPVSFSATHPLLLRHLFV